MQRRLDAQYDRIDEVEETMAELKFQIYALKKNQIDADSIYRFLGAFNEVYSECTDAEKKQFMQAFIERIDIFPERREDGNWIQNIKFQFPVPIIKEGKEVAQIKEISLDKIYNYFSENREALESEKRSILLRIIVPDNEESRDQIIFATNNQTNIPKATLRVTDPIHLQIEMYFKSRGLFYDRRKNYYKNQGRKPAEIVGVSFLA